MEVLGLPESEMLELFAPINWDWSSTIKYRRDLVRTRRAAVVEKMDSMTADQIRRAEEWLKNNTFHDLFNC